MNRFLCFILSCLMVYSCFQTITTIRFNDGTSPTDYYVTTVQFLEGSFMTDEAYAIKLAKVTEKANELKTKQEKDVFLSRNKGSIIVYEIKKSTESNEKMSLKTLLLIIAMLVTVFLAINSFVFAFVCLFVPRFAKTCKFISVLLLISGVLSSVASVNWSIPSTSYNVLIGTASIFFIIYPMFMALIYSLAKKKS